MKTTPRKFSIPKPPPSSTRMLNPRARQAMPHPAQIWAHGNGVAQAGECLEIDTQRCCIAVDAPLAMGASVRVCLDLRGREVRFVGTVEDVASRDSDYVARVRVDGVAAPDRAQLRAHLGHADTPRSVHPLLAFGRPTDLGT